MDNLQALCIACNRRKGIREGTAEEKTVAVMNLSAIMKLSSEGRAAIT